MATRTVVVLALYVVGQGNGLRHSRAEDPRNTHPATLSCRSLTTGFGLRNGCDYPSAVEQVPDCVDVDYEGACYEVTAAEGVTNYNDDIRTSSQFAAKSRVVAEAEGGGWGVKVSASMSQMTSSQVSEQSLAFFIGASGRSRLRILRNEVSLKLTEAAKELLRSNATAFIARHGLRYVNSITYGGSFLGTLTLNSRQTKDDTAIQAFAQFSVQKTLFSSEGSAEFQDEVSKSSGSVRVTSSAKWRGGSGISLQPGLPTKNLYNAYQQWLDSWRDYPDPLLVSARRWIDCEEVQQIANGMSVEDREKFDIPDFEPGTLTAISAENAKISLIKTSILQALDWSETQADPAAEDCLEDLYYQVDAQLIRIQALDDTDVSDIQKQYLSGDFSWFESGTFEDSYESCIANIVVTTTTTTTTTTGPKDTLYAGESLSSYEAPNNQLISNGGAYYAVMSPDGNFCVCRSSDDRTTWCSDTSQNGLAPHRLVMQTDGNLVIYDSTSRATWSSGTRNAAFVVIGVDGNLCIVDYTGRTVWSSGIFGTQRRRRRRH